MRRRWTVISGAFVLAGCSGGDADNVPTTDSGVTVRLRGLGPLQISASVDDLVALG